MYWAIVIISIIVCVSDGERLPGTPTSSNAYKEDEIIFGDSEFKKYVYEYDQTKRNKIKIIKLGAADLTKQEWDDVKNFPNLENIDLAGSNIKDENIECLLPLGKITTLSIDNTKLTKKSIDTICKIKNLKDLNLGNLDLQSSDLKQIVDRLALKKLEINIRVMWFDIASKKESEKEISERVRIISASSTIESLCLTTWAVDNYDGIRESMRWIAKNNKIKELYIGAEISDREIVLLKDNQKIIKLSVGGKLTDKSLDVMCTMKGLKSLSISSQSYTDDGLINFLSNVQLTELHCIINNFDDKTINSLSLQKHLKKLEITCKNTPITEPLLDRIISATHLKTLRMWGKGKGGVSTDYIIKKETELPNMKIDIYEYKPAVEFE